MAMLRGAYERVDLLEENGPPLYTGAVSKGIHPGKSWGRTPPTGTRQWLRPPTARIARAQFLCYKTKERAWTVMRSRSSRRGYFCRASSKRQP